MQRLRYWVRDFFGFSRIQTNGFLILLPLMVVLIFSQPLYQRFMLNTSESKEDKKRNKFLDSLVAHWDFNPLPKEKRVKKPVIFNFNPNTASKDELERLGLLPYLAQRIINYRQKGGRFSVPSDLLKIYGMDSSWYAQVSLFIKLPVAKIKPRSQKRAKRVYKKVKRMPFDINEADSTQLKSIVGIGSVLATRIIKYRNRLGGFVNKHQLSEVYGLDSITVISLAKHSVIDDNFIPSQININTQTNMLSKHPYIKYKLGNIISAYHFQHGNFKTIDELLNIDPIDAKTLDLIKPYLKVDP